MTNIEWTHMPGHKGETWNPVVGCSVVSPGCANCYAMRVAGTRLEHSKAAPHYAGTTELSNAGPVWTGKIAKAPDSIFLKPFRWRAPRCVFVNSMGDIFHENVPDPIIDQVFAVMALCPQHTFLVLTKRAGRMRDYFSDPMSASRVADFIVDAVFSGVTTRAVLIADAALEPLAPPGPRVFLGRWPLPNVWLGVSAEDQRRAEERVPALLDTPAAKRFVSAEPLLGPIDFENIRDPKHFPGCLRKDVLNGHAFHEDDGNQWTKLNRVDWIIAGGESGGGARPNWTPNVRSIIRQCASARVACFVKQMGSNVHDRNDAGIEGLYDTEWRLDDGDWGRIEHDVNGYREQYQGAPMRIRLRDPKGGDPSEWPADLAVREWPA